jgi:hypothetical protein
MNTYAALLNVEKGRREVDLNDANRCTIEGLVPVEQLNKLDVTQIPWANVRIGFNDAKKSRVAKDIRTSLYLKDGAFANKHKGIRIIADSATLSDGKLIINFGGQSKIGNFNSNIRGVGDGGTTIRVTCEALKDVEDPFVQGDAKQYVRVFVYCGDYEKDETAALVESWNKGENVTEADMLNYKKEFRDLEILVEKTPFGTILPKSGVRKFPEVSFFSGDPGSYDVTDLIQFVGLFAMDDARQAYNGTGSCLSFFQHEQTRFQKMLPLMFDIIWLYESIVSELPSLYNGEGKNGTGLGRFAATRPVMSGSKKSTDLPFTGRKVPFTPNKAWTFPMLAAFRGALDTESTNPQWLVNPLELFRAIGAKVYTEVLLGAIDNKSDAFNIGRDSSVYKAAEEMVGRAAEKANRKGLYAVAGR